MTVVFMLLMIFLYIYIYIFFKFHNDILLRSLYQVAYIFNLDAQTFPQNIIFIVTVFYCMFSINSNTLPKKCLQITSVFSVSFVYVIIWNNKDCQWCQISWYGVKIVTNNFYSYWSEISLFPFAWVTIPFYNIRTAISVLRRERWNPLFLYLILNDKRANKVCIFSLRSLSCGVVREHHIDVNFEKISERVGLKKKY